MPDKTFPIQQVTLRTRDSTGAIESVGSFQIPWELAELAYREYARRYSNDQTMEQLKERHGFGAHEFADLLVGFFENDRKAKP